jgi:SAM-dependent methyltransferase
MSDYHDYVFKDGQFVGKFEEMYRKSTDIPWHQDETSYAIFTDIDIAILKHFQSKRKFKDICEVGCGYGYVSNRIKKELSVNNTMIRVTGLDISKTAIETARETFPDTNFIVCDILRDNLSKLRRKFNVVILKELLWYVLNDLDVYFINASMLTKRYIYISQSFPETKNFIGCEIFPDASTLELFISKKFHILHSAIEKDSQYNNRELIHIFAELQ